MFQPRTNAGRAAKPGPSRLSLSNLPSPEQRPPASRDQPLAQCSATYRCHVAAPVAGRPLRILREGDTLLRIAVSGCGRHVACSSRLGRSLEVARLTGLAVTQDKFLMGTQGPVSSVSWNLGSDRLVATSAAGLHLWSFPSGETIGLRPPAKASFAAAQFFFMDEFVLSAWSDTVGLFRLADGDGVRSPLRPVLQCRLPCREVLHVTGAAQFRSTLAVVCCSDHALRLLDVQAGRVASTLADVAFHPRRPGLAAALLDGRLQTWPLDGAAE
ncbi:uncharacterized protein LOC119099754 [Pollicipes pollicipes]|uniref:uncharacterized protein LOC119099754 n=1 Tax=Pollicipes pollicipes TaxID=41117 RepID=UPI0018857C64|nr:uncharacterized protein LOC119099754 [Pollicipes pollicipes]